MRLSSLRNDPDADEDALQFLQYLLKVGQSKLEVDKENRIHLPTATTIVEDIRSLCKKVFEGINHHYTDSEWLLSREILTTTNENLHQINEVVADMIPGDTRTYLSTDTAEKEDHTQLDQPIQFLNSLKAGSALNDHKPQLKNGYMVMFLRNLDPRNGHVNGTRYIVEKMTTNIIFLRKVVGDRSKLVLPRIPCGPGDDNFPVPGFIVYNSLFAFASPLQQISLKASPSPVLLGWTCAQNASRMVNGRCSFLNHSSVQPLHPHWKR